VCILTLISYIFLGIWHHLQVLKWRLLKWSSILETNWLQAKHFTGLLVHIATKWMVQCLAISPRLSNNCIHHPQRFVSCIVFKNYSCKFDSMLRERWDVQETLQCHSSTICKDLCVFFQNVSHNYPQSGDTLDNKVHQCFSILDSVGSSVL